MNMLAGGLIPKYSLIVHNSDDFSIFGMHIVQVTTNSYPPPEHIYFDSNTPIRSVKHRMGANTPRITIQSSGMRHIFLKSNSYIEKILL